MAIFQLFFEGALRVLAAREFKGSLQGQMSLLLACMGTESGDQIRKGYQAISLVDRWREAVIAADALCEMNARPLSSPETARRQLDRFPDAQCFLNNHGDNVWVTVDFARNSTLLEIVCSDAFYIPTLCQTLTSIMTTDSPLVVLHLHGLVRRVILPVLAKSETISVLESCLRLLSMGVVRNCCAFVPSATWGRCIRFESSRHAQFLCIRLMARCIHENKFLLRSHQHCAVRENNDVLVDCCITGPLQNRISALKLVKASKILSESGMRRLEEARLNMPSGFDRNFKWQLLAVANGKAMVLCKRPLSLQSVQCILSGYESPTDRGEIYKWGCIAKAAIMSLAGSDVHLDPGATPAARLAWSQILLKAQTQFYVPQRIWEAGLRLVPSMVCDFIRDVAATGSRCYVTDATAGDMEISGGSVAAEFLRCANCEVARASADMLLSAHADAIMQLSVLSNDMFVLDLSRPGAFCKDVEVKTNLFRDLMAGCTQLMRMEGLRGTIFQECSSSPLLRRTAKLLVEGVMKFLHFQITLACKDPFCRCWDTDIVRIGTELMKELYSTDVITLDTHVLRLMQSYVSSVSTTGMATFLRGRSRASLVEVTSVYTSLRSQIWPLGPEACQLGIEGCLGLLELAEEVDHYGMFCQGTVGRGVRTCFLELTPTQLCCVPDICALLTAAARRRSTSRAESSWLTSVLVRCKEGERLVAHSDCLLHELSQPFPTLYCGKILSGEKKSIQREERIFERLYRPSGEGRKRDKELAQVEMGLVPCGESSARGRKRLR